MSAIAGSGVSYTSKRQAFMLLCLAATLLLSVHALKSAAAASFKVFVLLRSSQQACLKNKHCRCMHQSNHAGTTCCQGESDNDDFDQQLFVVYTGTDSDASGPGHLAIKVNTAGALPSIQACPPSPEGRSSKPKAADTRRPSTSPKAATSPRSGAKRKALEL